MKTGLMLCLLTAAGAGAAEKPRLFITESQALQASGEASVAEAKGAFSLLGGTSPQNVEVMKMFTRRCPEVIVTSNPEKADYIVRFDHEGVNPTTPFVRGNKVAIFNRDDDLIYGGSTRLLGNGVKDACAAILTDRRR
ncbi:MAG: hypothetical protein KIT09_32855 [Bryobacteraceae bacterium]|nr:hypothetical protein [Bryobacteraceae bacterium]